MPSAIVTAEEAVFLGSELERMPILQIFQADTENAPGHLGEEWRRVASKTGEIFLRWWPKDNEKMNSLIPSLVRVDLLEPLERIRALINELSSKDSVK
jgi:hypothetical protein